MIFEFITDAPESSIPLKLTCKLWNDLLPRRTINRCNYSKYCAKNGYLSLLQWARANGAPWDEWTCGYAAENGHLEVLKWLRANNCPWNKRTCTWAARNGHLEVLKWLRANRAPWSELTCSYAAKNGQLEVLKWLRANGAKIFSSRHMIMEHREIDGIVCIQSRMESYNSTPRIICLKKVFFIPKP